jgi:lysophospholipase L1-like esterase
MPHLVLLGDSILDNGAYTAGGPAVIQQVREHLPPGWQATLNAIDGSTTADIAEQLSSLPDDATHLVLSVGGNDALLRADLLDTPVSSTSAALLLMHGAAEQFASAYARVVDACLAKGLPLVICTVYNGNFPEADLQLRAKVALTVFNDVIIAAAVRKTLKVIELRATCTTAADYANPIEPSPCGGAKIAAAIVRAVTEPVARVRGAQVVGG